ncbi:MAG: hypothetical protein KF855_11650 [Acidobacteria bacterium]|nr:hypothetical protein [Acidobacteriota bacterium]
MKSTPLPIHKLASDLGLRASGNPIASILAFCDRKVEGFLNEMDRCDSLADFLKWVEARVGTKFYCIRTENDLRSIVAEYVARGEKVFAGLEAELSDDVYGITYRLQNAEAIAPPFISIIDCRREKGSRAYFTKWHEIAHLLTLTDQQRLRFTRSHSEADKKDPEERLMDIIAGKFGFYDRIFHKTVSGNISFSELERVRQELCPEASLQSSLISFIKYWPMPCIYLRADIGLNRREKQAADQGTFDFLDVPVPVLRAVEVSVNERAREDGFQLFPNMRIPESSIVQTVFSNGCGSANSIEDFREWNSRSSGNVSIEARFRNGVEVLITPH